MSKTPEHLPHVIAFKAAESNTGRVTVRRNGGRRVELKLNGIPLKAGDLVAGRSFTINFETGEVDLDG